MSKTSDVLEGNNKTLSSDVLEDNNKTPSDGLLVSCKDWQKMDALLNELDANIKYFQGKGIMISAFDGCGYEKWDSDMVSGPFKTNEEAKIAFEQATINGIGLEKFELPHWVKVFSLADTDENLILNLKEWAKIKRLKLSAPEVVKPCSGNSWKGYTIATAEGGPHIAGPFKTKEEAIEAYNNAVNKGIGLGQFDI